MGVAWHPSTDAMRMLSWQPVFRCYITAFCRTASSTSSTHVALFLSVVLDRIVMYVTVAENAFSWLDVGPIAFYFTLLLEYQSASPALNTPRHVCVLQILCIRYESHSLKSDILIVMLTFFSSVLCDMKQQFRKWPNVLCVSKVFSELQCPAVLPLASMRLWSSVTMTKHATWAKVRNWFLFSSHQTLFCCYLSCPFNTSIQSVSSFIISNSSIFLLPPVRSQKSS